MTSLLQSAIALAREAHRNQTDRGGHPYFGHLERVAAILPSTDSKIVGYLHDILEDTDITYDYLLTLFPRYICNTIGILTKTEGEDYFLDYLPIIKENKIARQAKISDLLDNLDLTRLSSISERDLEREKKYKEAILYLST